MRSLPLSVEETLARAHVSGRPLRFGKPEFYVWKIRLAVERGLVRPHRVLTVALTGASFPTVKVWAGFVLLIGCKWLYEPGVPTVFSREFAAPWSDVTVDQARGAITALKQDGYMLAVGKHGRSTLWLPVGAPAEGVVPCNDCESRRSCAKEGSWIMECAAAGQPTSGHWKREKRT